jgi:hypothetical protein
MRPTSNREAVADEASSHSRTKTMKMQTREFHAKRFAGLREMKREREESKRWERFLVDRAEFDEHLKRTLDVWEEMMKNAGDR